MAKISPVDAHRHRRQIINALKDGVAPGEIVRQFRDPEVDLSTAMLKTYAKKYLPLALVHPINRDRARAVDVGEAIVDIEEAAVLLGDASSQARGEDGTVRDKTTVAAEFRQLAQARGRIGGWMADNVVVHDGDRARAQQLIKVLVAELTPVVGGLEALERALTSLEADAPKLIGGNDQ